MNNGNNNSNTNDNASNPWEDQIDGNTDAQNVKEEDEKDQTINYAKWLENIGGEETIGKGYTKEDT